MRCRALPRFRRFFPDPSFPAELMALLIRRLVALGHTHILFPRCLGLPPPRLRLSLRDTQRSRGVLPLAWPPSPRTAPCPSLS